MSSMWMHIGSVLLATTVTGTLLTSMVAISLRCLPKMPASSRSIVWTVTLSALVAMPGLDVLLKPSQGQAIEHAGGIVLHAGWFYAVFSVWMLLALFRAVQLWRAAAWSAKISRRARLLSFDPANEASKIDLECPGGVELCISPDVDVPCVAGLWRPRILFPQELIKDMEANDFQHILRHELEHIRNGDNWINLTQQLALVLFPLHPGVWLVGRRLSVERELACDERVVRATGARKSYAACLAKLAEKAQARRRIMLALAAWERRSEVGARVRRILAAPGAEWVGTRATASAVLASVVLLTVAMGMERMGHIVEFSSGPDVTTPRQMIAKNTASHAVAQPVAPGPAPVRLALARTRRFSHPRSLTTRSPISGNATPWDQDRADMTTFVKMDRSADLHAKEAIFLQEPAGDLAAIPVPGGWIIVHL